jgi:hypothetical protein
MCCTLKEGKNGGIDFALSRSPATYVQGCLPERPSTWQACFFPENARRKKKKYTTEKGAVASGRKRESKYPTISVRQFCFHQMIRFFPLRQPI